MSSELFFIYDSHCPWSYACAPLIKAVEQAFPDIKINLMHSNYYDGDSALNLATISSVEELSSIKFSDRYKAMLTANSDSTLSTNLLSWVEQRAHQQNVDLLMAIQDAHFQQGSALTSPDELDSIVNKLKLSPPKKCMQNEKLAKEAEFALHDIEEIQEMIGTKAIPALLFAHNDELILLNHNLYIAAPEKIVEALTLEMK